MQHSTELKDKGKWPSQ